MKNKLYALGLTALMGLYGCGKEEVAKTEFSHKFPYSPHTENSTETPKTSDTLPTTNRNVQNHLQGLEGTYRGVIDGMAAEYTVEADNCYLTLQGPKRVFGIYDQDCDNAAEFVRTPNTNYAGIGKGLVGVFNEYSRENLRVAGMERRFDGLLRDGWDLVKPENKVERDYQKELDDLLQP
ncbi:hypothetical protein HYV87_04825 [Candidatus Woesearchaeota archaeon]|nr:hypothetical protein [Candidatus Woesearchaeota archaeon]